MACIIRENIGNELPFAYEQGVLLRYGRSQRHVFPGRQLFVRTDIHPGVVRQILHADRACNHRRDIGLAHEGLVRRSRNIHIRIIRRVEQILERILQLCRACQLRQYFHGSLRFHRKLLISSKAFRRVFAGYRQDISNNRLDLLHLRLGIISSIILKLALRPIVIEAFPA